MAEGAAMLDQLKLAIVDVETTGAGVTGDRVIEIGVQRIERGRVTRTFQSLVDPEQRTMPSTRPGTPAQRRPSGPSGVPEPVGFRPKPRLEFYNRPVAPAINPCAGSANKSASYGDVRGWLICCLSPELSPRRRWVIEETRGRSVTKHIRKYAIVFGNSGVSHGPGHQKRS
jgi:hypothetical protein